MGIDYNNTVLGRTARQNAAALATDESKPKKVAKFWLNLGYSLELEVKLPTGETETQTKFVSLGSGIALDTMADLEVKGADSFRALQSARNALRDQLLEVAHTLKPGEARIIGEMGCGLELELRCVNDAKPEIKSEDNPYTKRLAFAA